MSVTSEKHDEEQQQPLTEDRAVSQHYVLEHSRPGPSMVLALVAGWPCHFSLLAHTKVGGITLWDAKIAGQASREQRFCPCSVIYLLSYSISNLPPSGLTFLHLERLRSSPRPSTICFSDGRWRCQWSLCSHGSLKSSPRRPSWHPRRVLLPVEQAMVASTQPKNSKQTRRKATQQHAASNGSVGCGKQEVFRADIQAFYAVVTGSARCREDTWYLNEEKQA